MSTPTAEVVVTEFLRPEGTKEPAVYNVHAGYAHLLPSLYKNGIEICCDIYPDGSCRVYFYSSVDEIAVHTSCKRSHSVAQHLLESLLYSFDFKTVL